MFCSPVSEVSRELLAVEGYEGDPPDAGMLQVLEVVGAELGEHLAELLVYLPVSEVSRELLTIQGYEGDPPDAGVLQVLEVVGAELGKHLAELLVRGLGAHLQSHVDDVDRLLRLRRTENFHVMLLHNTIHERFFQVLIY